ncbi:hypothetical protein [Brevundimonas mediterranea]|uniref:Uncharacterized protein n=1 Tax=Brevundimonas mediterranea TaxID=74329 RepID=A0A7W6A1R5_9CAUL|nr:hypothetical protein [Brevundimonas mediterranea]MBB3871651.1 hypothetical protein [Brevundimonas mediterranea]
MDDPTTDPNPQLSALRSKTRAGDATTLASTLEIAMPHRAEQAEPQTIRTTASDWLSVAAIRCRLDGRSVIATLETPAPSPLGSEPRSFRIRNSEFC